MEGKGQSAKLVECSKSRKEWSETLHQTYFPGPFGVGKKRDLGNEVEISLAKSVLHFVLSSLSLYVVCHTQSRKFSKVIHPSCGPTRVKDFPSFVNWELCICKKKKVAQHVTLWKRVYLMHWHVFFLACQQSDVMVISLFSTPENDILIQDFFPIDSAYFSEFCSNQAAHQ